MKASISGAMVSEIRSEYRVARLFGVISPKTRIMMVNTPTAMPGPALPNHFVARTVAMTDAAMFTRLFPINIVVSIREGSRFS